MASATKPGTFVKSIDAHDRFISIAQAADYLGVTGTTIRNMLADGRLRAYTLGPRVLRIKLSDITAALTLYGSN